MVVTMEQDTFIEKSKAPIKQLKPPKGMRCSSAIFEPYRSLGIVSNDLPFIVRYIPKLKEVRIITLTGRQFHSYSSKLTLVETSALHELPIQAVAADSRHVYTAAGNEIYSWKGGHKWYAGKFEGHDASVRHLLPFGPNLISSDDSSTVIIWELKTRQIYSTLEYNPESFSVSCLFHPATYVNKILLGSKQGTLELRNIRTNKMIYRFAGWGSAVNCIEQAPAEDVVAIGLESGMVVIHNLKMDESLMKFMLDYGSGVKSMSFRTDGLPILATSCAGHIALWDLEKRKLIGELDDRHPQAFTCVHFLHQEPVLVTSGGNNSLKVYCFDQGPETGRVLYDRSGHASPALTVSFMPPDGTSLESSQVLSTGEDSSLRNFNVWSERLNKCLGLGHQTGKGIGKHSKKLKHKHSDEWFETSLMPPITDFDVNPIRGQDWADLVATHQGWGQVTTWSVVNNRISNHRLYHKRFGNNRDVEATSVSISTCSNFVTIGYSTGHVDRFNLQSGLHRKTYSEDNNKVAIKTTLTLAAPVDPTKTAHEGPVSGVVSDALNSQLVTAGKDGQVKFWRFTGGQFLASLNLESPISRIKLHKDNGLLALALDNFQLVVIDIVTRQRARQFDTGDQVTSLAFTPNGRWLLAATKSKQIQTWDIQLAQLVDLFRVPAPCRSLSMSPTGELLATAHEGERAVYLWSNVTLYKPTALRPISLEEVNKEVEDHVALSLPTAATEKESASLKKIVDIDIDELAVTDSEDDDDDVKEMPMESDDSQLDQPEEYVSPEMLASNLITMSAEPESKWRFLLNLDDIKRRNKPKQPAKEEETAPFFIPVVSSLNPHFDPLPGSSKDAEQDELAKQNLSRIHARLESLSKLGSLLTAAGKSQDYTEVGDYLASLGPGKVDAELRSLSPFVIGTSGPLHLFLAAMIDLLDRRDRVDLYIAWIALALKIHADSLVAKKPNTEDESMAGDVTVMDTEESPDDTLLMETLERLRVKLHEINARLDSSFNVSLSLINFIKSSFV